MPKLPLNDDRWPSYQAIGTWVVAIGLLIYEGLSRHFVDQSGLALLGGLLGLPVIVSFDRKRRKNGDS